MNLDLDLEKSTVTIAGTRFPACALVCPVAPGQVDILRHQRLLGERGTYSEGVYIPMENGALAELDIDVTTGLYLLTIRSRHCRLEMNYGDPLGPLWLPENLCVSSLIPRLFIPGFQYWGACEADWLAETIQRFATYEVSDTTLDGPLAELIRLTEMDALEEASGKWDQ